jgi:hypothetical protein
MSTVMTANRPPTLETRRAVLGESYTDDIHPAYVAAMWLPTLPERGPHFRPTREQGAVALWLLGELVEFDAMRAADAKASRIERQALLDRVRSVLQEVIDSE